VWIDQEVLRKLDASGFLDPASPEHHIVVVQGSDLSGCDGENWLVE
jgi:hypothetical protein